jgi:hypothetical protein
MADEVEAQQEDEVLAQLVVRRFSGGDVVWDDAEPEQADADDPADDPAS